MHSIQHNRARQLATERRRKTLLVEYRASQKDNVFRDRRFGEGDPSMSLEEKMLLRFQKERQRRARASGSGGGGGKGGRFSLEEGEEEEFEEDEEYGGFRLTHKGRALGADDYREGDALASSDEEDVGGTLGKEIVKVGLCVPFSLRVLGVLFYVAGWLDPSSALGGAYV